MNNHDSLDTMPILYSFRRCPYAMRARMAILASGLKCELREVILRDKPKEMIAVSSKATVPVLVDVNGDVIDESLSIMIWALEHNDPENWLNPQNADRGDMISLITRMDGPFKHHLDCYKYSNRQGEDTTGDGLSSVEHRDAGLSILKGLDDLLQNSKFLFGNQLTLADVAIAPFIRQFANTDADWFYAQPLPSLQSWLTNILKSDLFLTIMKKYAQWQSAHEPVTFPPAEAHVR